MPSFMVMMRKRQTFQVNVFQHLLAQGRGEEKEKEGSRMSTAMSHSQCSGWLCPLSRGLSDASLDCPEPQLRPLSHCIEVKDPM